MTVTSQVVRSVTALGNGSNTNHTIGFPFQDNDHIEVYVQNEGVTPFTLTQLVYGGGAGKFTITGGDPGTTVVMGTALTSSQRAIIKRVTPRQQTVNYDIALSFPADDHEEQMDREVMIALEALDMLSRAVQLWPTTSGVDPVLPSDLVADAVLAVNDTADGFKFGPTTASIAGDSAAAVAAAAAAAGSEAAAAASAGAAAASEAAAAASAGAAATSESNAATSEANAAASETAAAGSAAAAATSEANAAASEAAAAASAASAVGSVIRTGAGAPAGGLGNDNDLYINTTNADYYLKVTGSWVLQGNLTGPTGATGPAGGGSPKQEAPSGSINSSNTNFTLSQTPLADAEVVLFWNGLLQVQGTDYTLAGTAITTGVAPDTGDKLIAHYRY